MRETLKEYSKYFIGISIICYFVLCIIFKNDSFVDNFDRAITISLFISFIYVEYLWKYNPLEKTPKIYGEYTAVLKTNYDNKKRKINISIKQNLISTRIYIDTKESKSFSISSSLIKKNDSWQLIYTYQNKPNSTEREHSEIHFGTAVLEIIDKKISYGSYYTDRKTLGDFIDIIKTK